MGNTSSERAAMGQGSDKAQRGGRERPKILMDSPEDADIFHSEDIKVSHAAFSLQQSMRLVNVPNIAGLLGERRVSGMAAGPGSG